MSQSAHTLPAIRDRSSERNVLWQRCSLGWALCTYSRGYSHRGSLSGYRLGPLVATRLQDLSEPGAKLTLEKLACANGLQKLPQLLLNVLVEILSGRRNKAPFELHPGPGNPYKLAGHCRNSRTWILAALLDKPPESL